MFNKYHTLLTTRPKLTNFITTGFLFGSGDVIAQVFFEKDEFNINRTLRAVFYGSCVFSFIGDKWYRILSTIKTPTSLLTTAPKVNAFTNTVIRTAADQLIWAPVGVPLYFTVMSQLERKTWDETKQKLNDNWWPTLKANWAVWPLFQLFNFGLVPTQYQLLTVNLISIAWNAYISLRNSGEIHQ